MRGPRLRLRRIGEAHVVSPANKKPSGRKSNQKVFDCRLRKKGAVNRYWQALNLNDAMRVLQLNAPVFFRYSVVYQNVQSSTGSIVISL